MKSDDYLFNANKSYQTLLSNYICKVIFYLVRLLLPSFLRHSYMRGYNTRLDDSKRGA